MIDASALTGFLLGWSEAVEAQGQELAGREHEPLHAPEMVEPETLNALRRLANAGLVTDRRATEAVTDLGKTRLMRYPHSLLRDRVWELRAELTAYDATYLALAEILDDAVLITADAGLAVRARASLGDERVRHLA